MRPSLILLVTTVIILAPIFLPETGFSQMDEPLQNWSAFDGRLQIEVPAGWVPMTADQLQSRTIDSAPPQFGLTRPDGTASMGIFHQTKPLQTESITAIKKSLVYSYKSKGWEIKEAGVATIDKRPFALIHCMVPFLDKHVDNFIGVTPLDGRLLVITFMATGKDSERLLMQGQLALGTVIITPDVPTVSSPDPSTKILRMPEKQPDPESKGTKPYGTRKDIPGFGVSMVVPSPFLEAMLLPGFISNDGLSALYVTSSNLPFTYARHMFDSEVLYRQGFNILESQDIEVDGHKGMLCLLDIPNAERSSRKWMLLLGDKKESITIHALFTNDNRLKMKEIMRAATLSVQWNPEQKTDWVDGLGIQVKESKNLKIKCRSHKRLVFATAGNSVPLDRTQPHLLVSVLDRNGLIDNLADFAIDAAKKSLMVSELKVASGHMKIIDGLEGYEFTGTIDHPGTGEEMDFFQTIIVGENKLCLIQGFMNSYSATDFFPQFVKISESLRIVKENQ